MRMSTVRRNLFANFAAKGFVAAAGLVFIPLYIHFLGIEAYAIVAVLPAISALSTILDFGLTPAINRQLASLSVEPDPGQRMRDLVRTCEIVVWVLAVAVGIGTAMVVPMMFGGAGQTQHLSDESLLRAAQLMGLVVGLHWPASYYNGAMIGLQRQVLLATANCVAAGTRGFGAVLILWLVSPTIEAFLIWQAVISIMLTLGVRTLLIASLPPADRPARVSLEPIKRSWRLAAGMSGTGIAIVVSTQMDKLVLSQLLPLETFGYYMLASAVASKLDMIVEPIVNSLFPRMTQLATSADFSALRITYRRAVELIAVVIAPATLVFVFFGVPILGLWTMNVAYGEAAGPLAAILLVGYALFALLDVTMFLDWALGRTRQVFWARLGGAILLLPALVILAHFFGVVGGAVAWPLVNGAVFVVMMPLVHSTWKECGAWWRWYPPAVMRPLIASLVVAGCWKLIPMPGDIADRGAFLAVVLVTSYAAAAFSSPTAREFAAQAFELALVRRAGRLSRSMEGR